MYYCQFIWSTCDYSFSDSETFTFMLPKEKQSTFISDYNKGVEKKYSPLDSLELAGAVNLPKTYGLIKSYQQDDQTMVFGDFKESENGLYLLSDSYNSFSDSYMTEKVFKMSNGVTKDLIEEWLDSYNKDLSKLKKEIEKENENWLKSFRDSDIEKEVKKALSSLKGKNKKNSLGFEDKIRKKLKNKEKIKMDKARELLTNKIQKRELMTKGGFINYVLKKSEGIEVEIDFIFESNDENSKII